MSKSPFFQENKNLPVFGKQPGVSRERAGWSTISTGKIVTCQLCKKDTFYLHQYKKYEEVYCCLSCLDKVFEK